MVNGGQWAEIPPFGNSNAKRKTETAKSSARFSKVTPIAKNRRLRIGVGHVPTPTDCGEDEAPDPFLSLTASEPASNLKLEKRKHQLPLRPSTILELKCPRDGSKEERNQPFSNGNSKETATVLD
jgi:hypothetical protein